MNYVSLGHVNMANFKNEEGIKVTNISGTHSKTIIGIFRPISNQQNKTKFYNFKFHKFIDGLIGYESHRDLNGQIDIRKNMLKVGRKTIKMQKRFPDNNKFNLTEREFQFVKVKTSENGEFLLEDERPCNKFTILPGLYKIYNNFACLAVQNHSKISMEVNSNELGIEKDYKSRTIAENWPYHQSKSILQIMSLGTVA